MAAKRSFLNRGRFALSLRLLPASIVLAALLLAVPLFAHAGVLQNTRIENQATATFFLVDRQMTVQSNVDAFVANPVNLAAITLYRVAGGALPDLSVTVPTTSFGAGDSATTAFTKIQPPVDLSSPLPLKGANYFHDGQPIFILVNDASQNQRSEVAETIRVEITSSTGDREILLLTETGPDTGDFAGYIQTTPKTGTGATSFDGVLTVVDSAEVIARYQESSDRSVLVASALVDPTGRVFDSVTGMPVDGATITFSYEDGQEAPVLGDDGVSVFPSTIRTGGTATDKSGRLYDFPPGGFRFPLISPGSYRLKIIPPPNYRAPSVVADSALQKLAGAPYMLSEASRGGTFVVNPGPMVFIDIPLDPVSKGLWLEKSAKKTTASVGDFVPFGIRATNGNAVVSTSGVVITDLLPGGLRYTKGSLRIGGKATEEPAISPDGATLRIAIGGMAPGETKEISYVTQVVPGARAGTITNTAYAEGGGVTSNYAKASLQVTEDLFASRSFLMGTVTSGACGEEGAGVKGVRIYLEDGTFVVTDKKGMFHFEGVKPGTHVAQLDLDSLPEGYMIVPCEENSRFAGRAYSQFVDLQGGTLWKVDFHVDGGARKGKSPDKPSLMSAQPEDEAAAQQGRSQMADAPGNSGSPMDESAQTMGEAGLELKSAVKGASVEYQVKLWGGGAPLNNMRLAVELPDGVSYEPTSSELDGKALADPQVAGSLLTYPLGNAAGEWVKIVRFRGALSSNGAAGEKRSTALLHFDTQDDRDLATPIAENLLSLVREENRVALPEMVLHSHFPTFGAELGAEDKNMLDELAVLLTALKIEQISVTGHTDNVRIAPKSRGIFRDNEALSLARAKTIGHYLLDKLHLPPAKLNLSGMGESRPTATNRTEKGRALNRRVEIRILTERVTEKTRHNLIKDDSGAQKREITGGSALSPLIATGKGGDVRKQGERTSRLEGSVPPSPGVRDDAGALQGKEEEGPIPVNEDEEPVKMSTAENPAEGQTALSEKAPEEEQVPEFDQAWLENAEHGRDWVWPPAVYFPSITSTHIAVKHHPSDKVTITVNGEVVPSVLLEKVLKTPDGAGALSYWRGVPLKYGDNRLLAVIQPPGGEKLVLERIAHVSSAPVKAEIVPEMCRLIADGKNPPVIALRLLDKDDAPVRLGVAGKFSVNAPYEPFRKVADNITNDNLEKDGVQYLVGREGVALVRLQPTTRSGEVTLTVPLNDRDEHYRLWLTAEQRDWILVGLAEGAVGYNTASGHMENLRAADGEDRLYEDGRLAFFAKGSIQGKWLLTMAYDSAKSSPAVGNGLFQTIDPNTYYTLYGDASQQQNEAASTRKLYLKIERDRFYALFGDFNTGLSLTDLSRYSRTLNGVKTEYQGKNLEFNLFGSETGQVFARDEVRGDGTSGLYHLSRKNIVLNTEKITIETRDRFRSEIIIASRSLARYIDYTIDYANGTIFFKEPIYSRDEKFNPTYIVAEYETLNDGVESLTLGGRVGAKLLDETVRTGVSYIHEGQINSHGDLYGVDASWQIDKEIKVKAEAARTDTNFAGVKKGGNSYLAEVEQRSAELNARLYFRELDEGFGLGQQSAGEAGTRKLGADASYKLQEKLSLNSQAYRQYNLATGAVSDMVEAKAFYTGTPYGAYLGARHASDQLADGGAKASEQLTMGASWLTLDKKLNLHVDHDQSIGGAGNANFPTRTMLGADFKLIPKVILTAQQEFTNGAGARTNSTRFGAKSNPWEGGTISSSMERNLNENGDRIFALFGLKQFWKLTDKWSVDTGLDRSQTVKRSQFYTANSNVPPASGGGEDFTAVSLGTNYQEKKWNWNMRVEARAADTEDKRGLITSIVGELQPGLGGSSRLQVFDSHLATGQKKLSSDLRFGLAYRPFASRWIILDRLDLLFDRDEGGTVNLNSRRIVNNLNLNVKPQSKLQISLQYGSKYVRENIDGMDFSGYTDLIGVEARHDLTKSWDLGLHGSVLHSWNAGQLDYSAGASVGYNVMNNAWVSLGYNLTGFEDKDFSRANFTAKGPFIRFRFKFDQASVRDVVGLLNHE